MIKVYSLMSVL